MESYRVFAVIFGLLAFLAVPAASQTYDNSPAQDIVIPECIWAAATGGGTWVSELQITDLTGGTIVSAEFWYGGGSSNSRHISNLWTSPGQFTSVKYSNILSSLQSLDSGFTYYGRVGTLWLHTQNASHHIQAQIRTVNGNYGKSFPGLRWVDSNTANYNRNMMILNLTQNATYRTFVGFYNATYGGYSMTVEFRIIGQNHNLVGSSFSKTFVAWDFQSFNPFVEAGVGTGTYDNCWLYIRPTSSELYGTGTDGLFCFGSSANNYTNDTSYHIAVQYQ